MSLTKMRRETKTKLARVFAGFLAAAMAIGVLAVAVSAEPMYTNELTGEPISASIQMQRPVAVMVDNDERALPHFGTADADIVYEMVNSTANNRITRLMCVYKNWGNIGAIGNIRSTRPTNVMLSEEYDAALIHDGGPFYINPYLKNPAATSFSGNFSRVNNGKAVEFTEYALAGDIANRFAATKTRSTYRAVAAPHFRFAPYGQPVVYPGSAVANAVSIPFPHNGTQLVYNASTGLYDYYEYGKLYRDADGKTMSFKNVFLQKTDLVQLDQNGYCIYNCIAQNQAGLYLTGGRAVPVYWSKMSESDKTRFYDATLQELVVSAGKSYIALVPSDSWEQVVFQ